MAHEEMSIENIINIFTKNNPRNDYKMIIGLNKSDLFNERRNRDNIHDVDVIINYDTHHESFRDYSHIFNFKGRDILLLRLNINLESNKLHHFGIGEMTEKNPDTFENNIFGRFREISFDWSTVKFFENNYLTILNIIFNLTFLLNRGGKLYLPNLNTVQQRLKEYMYISEDSGLLIVDNKININLDLDEPHILVLKNKIKIDKKEFELGSNFTKENIFLYNFKVLQTFGYYVNPYNDPNMYPIKNSSEINSDFRDGIITDMFYIIQPTLIPYYNPVLGYMKGRDTYMEKLKTINYNVRKFYNISIKNKYLYKYLKYKQKYLKLKNS